MVVPECATHAVTSERTAAKMGGAFGYHRSAAYIGSRSLGLWGKRDRGHRVLPGSSSGERWGYAENIWNGVLG